VKFAVMCASALAATALIVMLTVSSAEAARRFRRTYGYTYDYTYDYQHSQGNYTCTSDPKGFCRTPFAR
jgi:hypothetical protein